MRTKELCLLIAVLTLPPVSAFAARTVLYYEGECCRNITQGEFAILYCQALQLREPAQGWTVQGAAAALSALGHQPEKGWALSGFLTESTLSRLLQNSAFNRKSFSDNEFRRSTKLVTIANARNAVPAEDAITQGEFAILLTRALNLPAPLDGSPEAAVRLLSTQPIPLKPVAGWQIDIPLKEKEMIEILSSTPFRPSSVDSTAEISALQAFSLLLGKSEIATQGHFGLYIVEALGIPPPPGGWTMKKALDYVGKELGVSNAYGMHRSTPLCSEFFVNSLREILLKLWQPASTPVTSKGNPALLGALSHAAAPTLSFGAVVLPFNDFSPFALVAQQGAKSPSAPPRRNPAWPNSKEVDNFIKELRSSGLLPTNQCQPVPAQGFSKAEQGPIGPRGSQPAAPPRTPQQEPPATTSTPIPPLS